MKEVGDAGLHFNFLSLTEVLLIPLPLREGADDLFGMPNGSPITDRIIEASIQWAERIIQRIDTLHPE